MNIYKKALIILATKNLGPMDRLVRALLLPGAVMFWQFELVVGVPAGGLIFFSGVMLLTSVLGSCSVYYMLGFSTCPLHRGPEKMDYGPNRGLSESSEA